MYPTRCTGPLHIACLQHRSRGARPVSYIVRRGRQRVAGRLSIAVLAALALTVAGCVEQTPPTAPPSVPQKEGPPVRTDKAKLLELTTPFRMPIDDTFAL